MGLDILVPRVSYFDPGSILNDKKVYERDFVFNVSELANSDMKTEQFCTKIQNFDQNWTFSLKC